VPDTDGTFRGEILEFPGCIATGDTPSETLSALEEAAESWLVAVLARGQSIPDPVDNAGFSGRMVLRLPKSLHKKATRLAQRDGVSLNQFIIAGLAEHVGERTRPDSARIINFLVSTPSMQGSFSGMLSGDVTGPLLSITPAARGIYQITNTQKTVDQWQTLPSTQ
jgi:predicted RNase H-like HicB family nuclease